MSTALRLFLIAFVTASALSFVNRLTGPLIEANEKKIKESAMELVLPGFDGVVFADAVETGNAMGVISYAEAIGAGFVIFVENKGDQGNIVTCVGIDKTGAVLGVMIVSHNETPGLGSLAAEPSFLSQFTGQAGVFKVVRDRRLYLTDIVAVTAATVTSGAVAEAVNMAVEFFNEYLREI